MWNKRPNKTGNKNYFSMQLDDNSPMPQGKFKGEKMEDVPYWHLLWLADQPFCRKDVREYVEENRDVLEVEKKRDKFRTDNQ